MNWTDAEHETLDHLYPTATWEELFAALPGRTKTAIVCRASLRRTGRLVEDADRPPRVIVAVSDQRASRRHLRTFYAWLVDMDNRALETGQPYSRALLVAQAMEIARETSL